MLAATSASQRDDIVKVRLFRILHCGTFAAGSLVSEPQTPGKLQTLRINNPYWLIGRIR